MWRKGDIGKILQRAKRRGAVRDGIEAYSFSRKGSKQLTLEDEDKPNLQPSCLQLLLLLQNMSDLLDIQL